MCLYLLRNNLHIRREIVPTETDVPICWERERIRRTFCYMTIKWEHPVDFNAILR